MKLSEKTLTVLKNFAGINNSILVKQGKQLRTMSVAKNILGEAQIEEEFPRNFAIYDLSEFLGVISLFNEPDFDFDTYYVSISDDNKASSQYFYADKSMVTVPPALGFDILLSLGSSYMDNALTSGSPTFQAPAAPKP